MPKLIDYIPWVEVSNITKLSDMPKEQWKWREIYIGMIGDLDFYESEIKHPGKKYLRFKSVENDVLRTGYGEYSIDENTVTMKTKNSIYEFRIISRER